MVDTQPIDLTRELLGEFIPNPRTIRAFENINFNNAAVIDIVSDIQDVPLLGITLSPVMSNDRYLNPGSDVTYTDGGAKGPLTFGLTNTGVSAAIYGSATQIAQIAVDEKGRLTLASNITLVSDNVTEGTVNLYFTEARARASLSGGNGIDYNSTTGVIALDAASTENTDHASVVLSAGNGLTGGGNITASRSFAVGAGPGIDVTADAVGLDTASPRNADHSAISINAGTGLTGGGTIDADRTIGLDNTGVAAGTYSPVNSITVDAQGRITAIS